MLHSQCKHSVLHNHETSKHEKGLRFQTESKSQTDTPPERNKKKRRGKKQKQIHNTHSHFAAFLKQENVNKVIFSTCCKTDRFSQAVRGWEKRRERGLDGKEWRWKKKWPTHDRRPPHIYVCECVVFVLQPVRCGPTAASHYSPRAPARWWWPQHAANRQTGSVKLWV